MLEDSASTLGWDTRNAKKLQSHIQFLLGLCFCGWPALSEAIWPVRLDMGQGEVNACLYRFLAWRIPPIDFYAEERPPARFRRLSTSREISPHRSRPYNRIPPR